MSSRSWGCSPSSQAAASSVTLPLPLVWEHSQGAEVQSAGWKYGKVFPPGIWSLQDMYDLQGASKAPWPFLAFVRVYLPQCPLTPSEIQRCNGVESLQEDPRRHMVPVWSLHTRSLTSLWPSGPQLSLPLSSPLLPGRAPGLPAAECVSIC